MAFCCLDATLESLNCHIVMYIFYLWLYFCLYFWFLKICLWFKDNLFSISDDLTWFDSTRLFYFWYLPSTRKIFICSLLIYLRLVNIGDEEIIILIPLIIYIFNNLLLIWFFLMLNNIFLFLSLKQMCFNCLVINFRIRLFCFIEILFNCIKLSHY